MKIFYCQIKTQIKKDETIIYGILSISSILVLSCLRATGVADVQWRVDETGQPLPYDNVTRSKYKGTGAGNDEKSRL